MAAEETYINIDKVAELKGLKSNRSLRVEINKENSKYKARKIKTQGGYTYEILFSTLESEIQEKLIDEEIKSHSLIPVNNHSEFRTQKLKTEALAKVDLITFLKDLRNHFRTQKEADLTFLDFVQLYIQAQSSSLRYGVSLCNVPYREIFSDIIILAVLCTSPEFF